MFHYVESPNQATVCDIMKGELVPTIVHCSVYGLDYINLAKATNIREYWQELAGITANSCQPLWYCYV